MKTQSLPQPFKPEKRRLLFYFFLFLFIISTPLVILYAEGYQNIGGVVVQTGGIEISASDTGSSIYIDGKQMTDNALFKRYTAMNIYPGRHSVIVQKEGFNTWTDNVLVRKGQITSIKIDLVPVSASTSVLTD